MNTKTLIISLAAALVVIASITGVILWSQSKTPEQRFELFAVNVQKNLQSTLAEEEKDATFSKVKFDVVTTKSLVAPIEGTIGFAKIPSEKTKLPTVYRAAYAYREGKWQFIKIGADTEDLPSFGLEMLERLAIDKKIEMLKKALIETAESMPLGKLIRDCERF